MRTARPRTFPPPLTAALLLVSAACAASAPLPAPAPSPTDACRLLAGDAGAGVVVRVGLPGTVSLSTAPVPRNAGEAFVFAHLFEGLIGLDCEGRVVPALAYAWSGDGEGRRWVFDIRPDARFWTGEPVTSPDIVASWRSVQARSAFPDGVRSIEILDHGRLAVSLDRAFEEPPRFLAHPSFAVIRPDSGAILPVVGTGPYRVAPGTPGRPSDPASRTTSFRVLRSGVLATSGDSRGHRGEGAPRAPSVIEIHTSADGDGRDLLDQPVGLLVTRDPATLDYGRALPSMLSLPLPWDRTHVLYLTGYGERSASEARPGLDRSFSEALARDAVREEARPAEAPFAWREDSGCAPLESAERSRVEPGERSRFEGRRVGGVIRVGYPERDPTARALAERLVALAATDADSPLGTVAEGVGLDVGSGPPVAVGLAADPLREALSAGALEGFVFAVARGLGGWCESLDEWGPSWISVLSRADRATLIPLVDTRASVLTRSPAPPMRVGGNRQPLLTPPRPQGPES